MKIFTRNQGKISLSACSSEGWLDISQEMLFHLEFSALHRVSVVLLFCHKGRIWDTKNSNSSRKPLVAQRGAKIQLLPWKPTQVGKLEEFEQSSVSAACAVQLLQHSQQTDSKRLHWFNQNCTFSPWKERAETPHAQSSIPVSPGSYWWAVQQEPPSSFSSFFCKKALKMRFYNPT